MILYIYNEEIIFNIMTFDIRIKIFVKNEKIYWYIPYNIYTIYVIFIIFAFCYN